MQAAASTNAVLVWLISVGSIACVILRPKAWPEAVWACLGAVVLVACGLLPIGAAGAAIAQGTDVYLFLTGMMVLAELARREGVFDWLAALAVRAARGSGTRLFALVYAVGVLVTVFLSNDATAVVLTPAVYAAVKKARIDAPAYLFICAFIANAASFVLPISNPANLVVYGRSLPPLIPWVRAFVLPSICSIGSTYVVLRWTMRNRIRGSVPASLDVPKLSAGGKRAAWGIVGAAVALMLASAFGMDLGLPTCAVALVALSITTRFRPAGIRDAASGVAWSILPFVAGLFVLVAALNRAGAREAISVLLQFCNTLPGIGGPLTASAGIAALSNVMNNLPSGLLAGSALAAARVAPQIRSAVMIGVDLGPNLSFTGSLATVLWLIAARREGIEISAAQFLKVGGLVMPPALLLAVVAARL